MPNVHLTASMEAYVQVPTEDATGACSRRGSGQ